VFGVEDIAEQVIVSPFAFEYSSSNSEVLGRVETVEAGDNALSGGTGRIETGNTGQLIECSAVFDIGRQIRALYRHTANSLRQKGTLGSSSIIRKKSSEARLNLLSFLSRFASSCM
jgi:hypothetical protein